MSHNKDKPNSVLGDIPENVPALQKAVILTNQAAKIGFDWPSIEPVFLKMIEELTELKEAIASGETDLIKDELGDVLFVCSNLARHLSINPENALTHANEKFERRFRNIEQMAYQKQPKQKTFDLDFLEDLWIKVKNKE